MFVDNLLLFVKALLEQIQCINSCLSKFYQALWLKVNNLKSKILFAKNIDNTMANTITQASSFALTLNVANIQAFNEEEQEEAKDTMIV